MDLELAHANRVATMRKLTVSIAHELNQPIAAAIMGAETAQRWLARQAPELEKAKLAIGAVAKDAKRAADIVGRIHALVEKSPAWKDNVEINEAIVEVIGLARSELLKNGIRLHTRLADGLPLIPADRVQLQQVMLNLIINAVEAMSQMSEGSRELSVSTETEPGGILVVVRDSGPGFTKVGFARAFEAYYTSKPSGFGTSLAICRSIVEEHGGRLWAAPNEPRGATFCFTVPSGQQQVGC